MNDEQASKAGECSLPCRAQPCLLAEAEIGDLADGPAVTVAQQKVGALWAGAQGGSGGTAGCLAPRRAGLKGCPWD